MHAVNRSRSVSLGIQALSTLILCASLAASAAAQSPVERFGALRRGAGFLDELLDVLPIDLNHDEIPDLVIDAYSGPTLEIQLGAGDGEYKTTSTITLPTNGLNLAAGDFNGDGEVDLVVTLLNTPNVAVLLGTGGGNFGAPTLFHAPTSSAAVIGVAVGDLNGDGHADLTVACSNSSNAVQEITVLLGDGGGGFAAPVHALTILNLTAFRPVLGDLNHDGKLDLTFPNPKSSGSSIEVYFGDGHGGFQFDTSVFSAKLTRDVAIADMNEDGHLDLVSYANHTQSEAQIFLGDGAGNFTLSASQVTEVTSGGYVPIRQIAIADFDGDGHLDGAFVGMSSGNVAVLRGDGHGLWASSTLYPAGVNVTSIAALDADSDGRVDLACADYDGREVAIMLNRGAAVFDTFHPGVLGTGSVVDGLATDVDADGRPDLLLSRVSTGALIYLRGLGNGDFAAPVITPTGTTAFSIAAADLNGDQHVDALLGNNATPAVIIRFGDGHGGFTSQASFQVVVNSVNVAVVDAELADFNGDGKLDIVATVSGQPTIAVLLGDGAGGFGPTIATPLVDNPLRVATGDFNHDGKVDVATSSFGPKFVDVAFGNGAGGFTSVVHLPSGGNYGLEYVVAADFDGDGNDDIAASSLGLPGIMVWHSNGNGTFAAPTTATGGSGTEGLIRTDFDGDGRPDLAVVNINGASFGMYLNDGSGSFTETARFGHENAFCASMAAADFDGDGRVDVAAFGDSGAGVDIALQRNIGPSCTGSIHTYCTAKLNSLGCDPIVAVNGSPSASAGGGCVLHESHVLNHKSGLFFYSTHGKQAAPFEGGTLCVKLPLKRTAVQSSGGNPPPNDCTGSYSFDFNAWIANGTDPNLIGGADVWGQFWSRDPGFAPPSNTGLSAGVHFTICP